MSLSLGTTRPGSADLVYLGGTEGKVRAALPGEDSTWLLLKYVLLAKASEETGCSTFPAREMS